MPIYEFKCKDCEKITEALLFKSTDVEPVECEHCKSGNIEKIMSQSSFQLKGSGWTGKIKPKR